MSADFGVLVRDMKKIDALLDKWKTGIPPENTQEYWSLVGEIKVETSTSIPDGEYKLYHETWPYKEEKAPFVHPSTGKFLEYSVVYEPVDENFSDSQMVKYYADSLVTTTNCHFDVKTVMTAFDQIVRKSKDYSHIYARTYYEIFKSE